MIFLLLFIFFIPDESYGFLYNISTKYSFNFIYLYFQTYVHPKEAKCWCRISTKNKKLKNIGICTIPEIIYSPLSQKCHIANITSPSGLNFKSFRLLFSKSSNTMFSTTVNNRDDIAVSKICENRLLFY